MKVKNSNAALAADDGMRNGKLGHYVFVFENIKYKIKIGCRCHLVSFNIIHNFFFIE